VERLGGDDKHAIMGEAAGDRRLVERHGRGTTVLSSARWRRWMIVDGRGGARCLVKFIFGRVRRVEKSSVCKVARSVIVCVESVSRRCVQVLVLVKRR
jgi:hypothetical protein